VLGLITIVAIQRAIHKVLISVFLSREFKHDETNRAWWTGKWYGRGLGAHALSQPAREFIVKVIELSLWSSDFLIGHFLLIMLTPALLFPYVDRLHSILLCEYSDVLLCGQAVFNLLAFSLVATVEADPRTHL
jgi:1,3-beta-glucan synthase